MKFIPCHIEILKQDHIQALMLTPMFVNQNL